MLTAEEQTHNYIIIRLTKTIYNSIRHSGKNNRGYNIYYMNIFRGEHSFRYMTDAIFIDINKSFIDINNYDLVNHLYGYQ